ncbi:hypothetical protein [Sinorhizobium fredii]|uniref:hypothetical protein n=1 Tax=Rhizobium fredii TaxID=380 RepID=UPI0004B19E2C|nr:hypothetical protein [Sinorhizobium fredii]AWI60362.1 hypothetical protein AB395_00005185 [Sinorhizobium fredii CCBAU 45436]
MNNHKPTFYYVNAHAGSGKTYSAHQYISLHGGFFTIATQTNDLSDQQAEDLAELGIQARVIRLEKGVSKSCTERYVRHCKDLRESTAIINQKVAHQDIEAARNQHLIVDEFPSPVEKFTLNEGISATRSFIGNLIKAVPCEFPGFLEVIDTDDTAEIAESGKSQENSLKEHVVQICERIHSEHYRLFVADRNYINFNSGLPDDESVSDDQDESKKRLVLYAWVQPSILKNYRSVTFMGANFPDQKLFHYWKDKVNWVEHPEIKGERYDDFSHKAPLIDFRHMNEGDDLVSWSHLSNNIGYQNFVDSVADVVAREFPGEDHIVTTSAKDDASWKLSGGEKISPNPVGLNAFQDRHVAVHLAPLRPSNMDFAIWQAVAGVSPSELMIAQACEMQYQFFTRTASRDGKHHSECDKRLTFITIDLAVADYLREVFCVEKPSELLVIPALTEYVKPPRKTRSDKKSAEEKKASKTARQRERRAEERAAEAAAQLNV